MGPARHVRGHPRPPPPRPPPCPTTRVFIVQVRTCVGATFPAYMGIRCQRVWYGACRVVIGHSQRPHCKEVRIERRTCKNHSAVRATVDCRGGDNATIYQFRFYRKSRVRYNSSTDFWSILWNVTHQPNHQPNTATIPYVHVSWQPSILHDVCAHGRAFGVSTRRLRHSLFPSGVFFTGNRVSKAPTAPAIRLCIIQVCTCV